MFTHLVLSASSSPKTSIVTHKTSIFFINLQEMVWVFLLFSIYFKFLTLVFLDFVYVEIWKYGCWIWFCWFCYNACSTYFTCLFFILMHWTMLCVVCAYHVHDKMSLRYFCVSLWIPLGTKMVGIIMFLDFETSNDFILFFYFFLTLPALVCTLLHMMRARAHTHTFFDMLSE